MRERVRIGLSWVLMLALAVACAVTATGTTDAPAAQSAAPNDPPSPDASAAPAVVTAFAAPDSALIERGRYMTAAADCAPCHVDPKSGAEFAGGRALPTPFGTMVSANITPDPQTGIGQWTDAQFEAAVREGKRPDGSRLYPAMPYPYYSRMSHDDVLAIRAYLRTVAPVHHAVVSDQLPFPFNIRAGMHLWDAMYFKPEPFRPDPAQSPAWNRGAYLVLGAGHCGACHTPKNFLGADHADRALQGYSLQGWFAPNITGDEALGVGDWPSSDIVSFLKNGHGAIAGASGPMGEVVAHSTTALSDADLAAIATYLKSQRPASVSRTAIAATDPRMKAGEAIYQDRCSACHQHDGRGVPYMVPNLVKDPAVDSGDATSIVHVLLQGAEGLSTAAEPTGASMPSFAGELTNAQLAAVTTYIRNSWGNAAAAIADEDFRKARQAAGNARAAP